MTINSPERAAPPQLPPQPMAVDFVGDRSALFWLALKTGFFTILTLGFYRFWMKTRLRRWYWSSIRPGGTPMEYMGDPWEKLLGFFIAVVILTFYLGIVNLILMFISFSYFESSTIGYLSSFVGVIPLWFYATYRARRYVLGRTRWRGVRFALEPAAWAYTWRAMLHWALTICTAGILWPRMTFYLEKFRTDRTYFGSARLHQGGKWWMLYRAAVPLLTALALTAIYVLWLAVLDPLVVGATDLDWTEDLAFNIMFGIAPDLHKPVRLWLLLLIPFVLFYGVVYYRFTTKQIMANHKTSDGVVFASRLRPLRISLIYIFGTFIAYLILVIGLAIILWAAAGMFGPQILAPKELGGENPFADLPRYVSFTILAVLYLSVFLFWGVLYNTFVTFPLMKHMAITTRLENNAGLAQISQRARDEFAEAEGFAEALDLGAAI